MILKVDYTLLMMAVATGHNGKEVLSVLLELPGQRTNCDVSQSFKGQTLVESVWHVRLRLVRRGFER